MGLIKQYLRNKVDRVNGKNVIVVDTKKAGEWEHKEGAAVEGEFANLYDEAKLLPAYLEERAGAPRFGVNEMVIVGHSEAHIENSPRRCLASMHGFSQEQNSGDEGEDEKEGVVKDDYKTFTEWMIGLPNDDGVIPKFPASTRKDANLLAWLEKNDVYVKKASLLEEDSTGIFEAGEKQASLLQEDSIGEETAVEVPADGQLEEPLIRHKPMIRHEALP